LGESGSVILTFAVFYGRANAATASSATAGPHISALTVIPRSPIEGRDFQVSFKTATGGSYVVFEATENNGGPIHSGSTGAGKHTTMKLGRHLRAGRYTIGVDLTLNNKTKRVTTKITIK
jgi:hypothetical protein